MFSQLRLHFICIQVFNRLKAQTWLAVHLGVCDLGAQAHLRSQENCTCTVLLGKNKTASPALLLALSASDIPSLLIKKNEKKKTDNCLAGLLRCMRCVLPSPVWQSKPEIVFLTPPPSLIATWRHDLWGTCRDLPSGGLIFQKTGTNCIERAANKTNDDQNHVEMEMRAPDVRSVAHGSRKAMIFLGVLDKHCSVRTRKNKKKQQLFRWPHCHLPGKCVISSCLQAWHTCSSSFAVMFAFKKRRGCQPLSPAVTEAKEGGGVKERQSEGWSGKKRAPQCVPFFQQSDWLNAAHVKKWAFTWVYNGDYITYTVASLYPWRLPSAPRRFTHS